MAAPGSIQDSVEQLARNCADKKLRRVYGAFVPIVEALKDYTGVIDTMSASPIFTSLQMSQLTKCVSCSPGLPNATCTNLGWLEDCFGCEYFTANVKSSELIVLQCAGRYSQQFDKIKTELQRLPDILWDLSGCEDIYGTSPYGADVIRRTICASYQTIFKFWYRSAKILEHPSELY